MDYLYSITQHYWECEKGLDERLEWYITHLHEELGNKSLLEAELAEAESRGNIEATPCTTLVLLVGYSLEPLLQSVCVYKPKKIILLLNEDGYGENEEWHQFAQHLTEAIGHLVEKGLLDNGTGKPPEFPGEGNDQGYPVKDEPLAVFQKLVEVLKEETDVVIDVTGGKKSMVSGAYMYAAYAGTRISYVDFDEYDPEYRRPYGYTCKIGGLANPYEAFALREWERVRALYKRYQFREARQILDMEIRPAMAKWSQETIEAIKQLGHVLHFYDLWDSGNYREAHKALSTLPKFKVPVAVTELGPRWYEFQNDQISQTPQHFYGKVGDVKVYVYDELARIKRLIKYNEDYRSAFLRAAGLNEVVLVARLVDYIDESKRTDLLNALDEQTPQASVLFKWLGDPPQFQKWKKIEISFKEGKKMNRWWTKGTAYNDEEGWREFLNHRNKLAHTYFSVPRKWAEDALAFVQANVEDFWGPIENMNVYTEALPWPELCEVTKVANFLPYNLRKEA